MIRGRGSADLLRNPPAHQGAIFTEPGEPTNSASFGEIAIPVSPWLDGTQCRSHADRYRRQREVGDRWFSRCRRGRVRGGSGDSRWSERRDGRGHRWRCDGGHDACGVVPASYFMGWRKYSRPISELKGFNQYDRTPSLASSQLAADLTVRIGRAATVFSRWSQSSQSLRQAATSLQHSNFPLEQIVYGRTPLYSAFKLKGSVLLENADEIPDLARTSGELDWIRTQLRVSATQGPTIDGWTSTTGFDDYVVQQSVLITCLRDPSDGGRSVIGVSSPVSSLTEAILGSLTERLALTPLNPDLLALDPRDLAASGLLVRSLRYFTQNTHVLERYSEPDRELILARLGSSGLPGGIRRIEAVTVGAGNISLNVFDDGQVYFHNVDPDDVPGTMSRLLAHMTRIGH